MKGVFISVFPETARCVCVWGGGGGDGERAQVSPTLGEGMDAGLETWTCIELHKFKS